MWPYATTSCLMLHTFLLGAMRKTVADKHYLQIIGLKVFFFCCEAARMLKMSIQCVWMLVEPSFTSEYLLLYTL